MTNSELWRHVKSAYGQCFYYKGRSPRAAIWAFFGWMAGLMFAYMIALLLSMFVFSNISTIFDLLIILLPVTGVTHTLVLLSLIARRLHDIGVSGWWTLLILLPGVGFLLLVCAVLALPGREGPNRYGPDPLRFEHAPGQDIV